jgi:hypothetical protein
MVAGAFGPEVSLITDAGARRDLSQLAAATTPDSLGPLYSITDRLAVGEELFAAGAQIDADRRYLASLTVHDILRAIVVLAIIGSALMALVR